MSNTVKNWTEWLTKSRFSYMTDEQKEQTLKWLFSVRDKVLTRAKIKPTDTLLDIGTGTGLLAFGAYELLKNTGKVIASDKFEDCVKECLDVAKQCGIEQGFEFLQSAADNIKLEDNSVDVVVMRSVLVHITDKQPVLNECYRVLNKDGRISIFEPIISSNTRYNQLVNPENITNYAKFKEAEDEIMSRADDPLTNFDDKTLVENFKKAGFEDIDLELGTEESTYMVHESMIDPWFNTPPSPGTPTMKQKFLLYFEEDEVNNFINEIKNDIAGKTITVKSFSAYISGCKN
ncbi:MAG: methyltransferase domain-containing protein [Candidatus Gastranaerophilaceae bacterium]|jgi:ubiquinone/menaquinone biosynthesis C-methylase UbiE